MRDWLSVAATADFLARSEGNLRPFDRHYFDYLTNFERRYGPIDQLKQNSLARIAGIPKQDSIDLTRVLKAFKRYPPISKRVLDQYAYIRWLKDSYELDRSEWELYRQRSIFAHGSWDKLGIQQHFVLRKTQKEIDAAIKKFELARNFQSESKSNPVEVLWMSWSDRILDEDKISMTEIIELPRIAEALEETSVLINSFLTKKVPSKGFNAERLRERRQNQLGLVLERLEFLKIGLEIPEAELPQGLSGDQQEAQLLAAASRYSVDVEQVLQNLRNLETLSRSQDQIDHAAKVAMRSELYQAANSLSSVVMKLLISLR